VNWTLRTIACLLICLLSFQTANGFFIQNFFDHSSSADLKKSVYSDSDFNESAIINREDKTVTTDKTKENLNSGNDFSSISNITFLAISFQNNRSDFIFDLLKRDFLSPINIIFPFHSFW